MRTHNANAATRACTLTPSAGEVSAPSVTWGLAEGVTAVPTGGVPPGVAMMADAD